MADDGVISGTEALFMLRARILVELKTTDGSIYSKDTSETIFTGTAFGADNFLGTGLMRLALGLADLGSPKSNGYPIACLFDPSEH
jgi:hypothetical protein